AAQALLEHDQIIFADLPIHDEEPACAPDPSPEQDAADQGADDSLTLQQDEPPAPMAAPAAESDKATDPYGVAMDALFDPVKAAQLETMFPDGGKWKNHCERAKRNGLKSAAKTGRGLFNPYSAAVWWLRECGPGGWDWARCLRKLANNLPPRSIDSKHLLTGYE
ncbi:MAG: hypothetical protein IPP85_06925, partial [Propionivibrio sp.]|nr:hypothetical protein [Propionivibrio sp.]